MIAPYFMTKEKALWYCRQSNEFLSAKLKEAQRIAEEAEERARKAREMAHFLSHQLAERVARRLYQMERSEREEALQRIRDLSAEMEARREEYAE